MIDPAEAAAQKTKTAEALEKLTFEGHRCPDRGGLMVKTCVSLPRLRAPPGGTNA